MDQLLKDYGNQGIAVTILAFLGYGLWRAVAWLGPNVLAKLVERVHQFFDQLEASLARGLARLDAIEQGQAEIRAEVQANGRLLVDHLTNEAAAARPASRNGDHP